jgi:L-asparaginase II
MRRPANPLLVDADAPECGTHWPTLATALRALVKAGPGRFDTRVMERLGAQVFCKVGAEAVYGATARASA